MSVIVCVDDNRQSEEAIEQAAEFAVQRDSDLVLVHAYTGEARTADTDTSNLTHNGPVKPSPQKKQGERVLENLVQHAEEETETSPTGELLLSEDGDIVESVAQYVSGTEDEHIFIGHRGFGPEHEQAFGSFSKDMITRSPVPVTVVTIGD